MNYINIRCGHVAEFEKFMQKVKYNNLTLLNCLSLLPEVKAVNLKMFVL
jgi:hypothetical protein